MSSKILSVISETFKDANDSITVVSDFVTKQVRDTFKNDKLTDIGVIVNHKNGNDIKIQVMVQFGETEELVAIKSMDKVEAWVSNGLNGDRIWNLWEKLKSTLEEL